MTAFGPRDPRLMRPHPLADLIPAMTEDEFAALVQDVRLHGVREPLVTFEGAILDGRNRAKACDLLGKDFPTREFTGTAEEARALVFSLNLHRRHLTADQKRALIEAELKRDPAQSDRQIATKAKVSPTTVGKARAQAEATGDVSTMDTRKDTKGRSQPAKKATTKKVATKATPAIAPKRVDAAPRPVAVDPRPVDVFAQFKRFTAAHLATLPVGERTDMARRWVCHLQTAYLPERLSPPVDAAKEEVPNAVQH